MSGRRVVGYLPEMVLYRGRCGPGDRPGAGSRAGEAGKHDVCAVRRQTVPIVVTGAGVFVFLCIMVSGTLGDPVCRDAAVTVGSECEMFHVAHSRNYINRNRMISSETA